MARDGRVDIERVGVALEGQSEIIVVLFMMLPGCSQLRSQTVLVLFVVPVPVESVPVH